jgi:hypothetical protein
MKHLKIISSGLLLLFFLACSDEKKAKDESVDESDGPSIQEFFSKADFQANDQAWVHAAKGLTLRESPDPKGKFLGLLTYGSEVNILEAADHAHTYAAEKYDNWQLEGHWIKVDANGKTGYVFEGYLAPFPTIAEEPEADRELLEWFYMPFAGLKGEKVIHKADHSKGIVEGGYTQAFADGARFELELYEGGSSAFLHIPSAKMSLGRALVVIRSLYFQQAKKVDTIWGSEEQVLIVSSPDDEFAYFQLNIEEKEGKIIISALSAD